MPGFWGTVAKKAAQAGQKALTTYKAGQAAQKVASMPKTTLVKKTAPKPVVKAATPPPPVTPAPYYDIAGFRVNKVAANIIGIAAIAGTAVYIGKRMSR